MYIKIRQAGRLVAGPGGTAVTVVLTDEEQMLVETVRAFIDRDVKPTLREVEHANEYPEAWIEQLKRIGVYGLAIPEEARRITCVDAVLRGSHSGTGAGLDEPGRGDGAGTPWWPSC
jgi:alkylation response protein AidB-like acyl-CoA dehydrogenase